MKTYKFLNFTTIAQCIVVTVKKKLPGQILSRNELIFPSDFSCQFLANFAHLVKCKV